MSKISELSGTGCSPSATLDKRPDFLRIPVFLHFSFLGRMQHSLWYFIFLYCFFMAFSKRIDVTKHYNWKLLDHERCGNSNSDRIIGGKNASLGAYPWIARLGYVNDMENESYRCGGTLINRLYVITAAHCVVNLLDNFKMSKVRLGEHNSLTDPDCEKDHCAEPVQDFLPESIIVHQSYNTPRNMHDIALIRLNKPVTYNEYVMPICMINGRLLGKNFVGETAEVAGWGIYDLNDPKASTTLLTVKLPIVETEKCKQAFRKNVDIGDQQMCVGGVVGRDSCSGDSGGPLMKVESENGPPRYHLIGIVSFGVRHCGGTMTPAIYTKMSKYITWILDNISP